MTNLKVIVKPHHLRGNSWVHTKADPLRRCPLQEALEEQQNEEVDVRGTYVDIGDRRYIIPLEKWNQCAVDDFVEKANNGSEESYEVELRLMEQYLSPEPLTNF